MDSIDSSYTDENGITHNVTTNTCEICGLKYSEDSYVVSVDGCITTIKKTISYVKGEQVISSYSGEYTEENHNYVYSYEKHGETYDDRYTVYGTCTKCDYSYSWEDSGHLDIYFEIDLAEYNCCEGTINGWKCDICKRLDSVYDNFSCAMDYETNDYNAEDGITHTVEKYTCSTCGLVYKIDRYDVKTNECLLLRNSDIICTVGDNVIYSGHLESNEVNHSYVYSYEKHGETCDDGYTVTGVCSVCGDTYSYDDWGHDYDNVDELDLNVYDGCCGGVIFVDKCVVCNSFRYGLDSCSCSLEVTNTTDENGHNIETLTCSKCQFKMVYEYWQETNEEGITVNKEIIYFYYNDTKIKEIQN